MGETVRKNHVSPEGHLAMSANGTQNMAAWDRVEMRRIVAATNQDAVARAEGLVEKTIAELGGVDKLTARQASLIESQRTALLVLCLAQARLKRKGMLTRGNNPDPLLATINKFATLVRLNLEALGVPDDDPNAPPRGGIADWLAAREKTKKATPHPEDEADGAD